MAFISVDKKNLEKYQGRSSIGFGEESICYLDEKTHDVIKIYRENKNPSNIKFVNLQSSYFSFPKDVLIDANDSSILATILPFFPGEKIENGFSKDLEIKSLKEAYLVLCQELEKFNNVYMVDICLDNILFDEVSNRFYLIDTERWNELPDVSALNRAKIDLNLSHALYKGSLSWLKDYENLKDSNSKLYDFYIAAKNERYCSFLEFLDTLMQELETTFGVDAKIIADLTPKMYKK